MSIEERNRILTKKRWLVLAACCAANLALGAFFVWSVFAGPMAERLNALHGTSLSAADLAIVFSLGNGVGVISMVAGGATEKKLGSRRVILIGTALYGLGFIICGLANSVAILMLGFSIVGGLANGFAYVCTVNTPVQFFPDRKGFAGGLSTACYGISAIIMPPIADAVNRSMGVSWSFIIFGIAIIAIAALSCIFIIDCPEDFVPVGWEPSSANVIVSSGQDKSPSQLLRDPVFYVMTGLFFSGCGLGLMMISETASIARSMIGMTSAAAALAVSVLSLFNTFGRVAAGWTSDRIGRVNTLTLELGLAAIGLVLMYISGGNQSVALFCVGICLVGLCYGAFIAVYPGFSNDQFGKSYSSINFALMYIGNALSGFAGQILMQRIYSSHNSYRPAFIFAQGFVIIGFALCFVYKTMTAKKTG